MDKPNLETCTVQEACDYAVFKIVEQGGWAMDTGGTCVYGGLGNGRHCAVGWLLDHDNATQMGFAGSVGELSALLSGTADDIPRLITANLALFERLQKMHDACGDVRWNEGSGYHMTKLRDTHDIDISEQHWQDWAEMTGEGV